MSEYPVIVTYANYGYKDFADNLLINLSKIIKNHPVYFFCLDKELYDYLSTKNYDLNVTYEIFDVNVVKNFQAYNTAEYKKLTHTKVNVLRYILSKFDFIHFIDCDVICNIEPSPEFYANYAAYDIVFQYDTGYMLDQKTLHPLYNNWTCTGNMTLITEDIGDGYF